VMQTSTKLYLVALACDAVGMVFVMTANRAAKKERATEAEVWQAAATPEHAPKEVVPEETVPGETVTEDGA
jgi:hypothetical protein